jgi:hypothetical protein
MCGPDSRALFTRCSHVPTAELRGDEVGPVRVARCGARFGSEARLLGIRLMIRGGSNCASCGTLFIVSDLVSCETPA